MRTFADIPAGAALFIDSNTLLHQFFPHPVFGPACKALLERIANREVEG